MFVCKVKLSRFPVTNSIEQAPVTFDLSHCSVKVSQQYHRHRLSHQTHINHIHQLDSYGCTCNTILTRDGSRIFSREGSSYGWWAVTSTEGAKTSGRGGHAPQKIFEKLKQNPAFWCILRYKEDIMSMTKMQKYYVFLNLLPHVHEYGLISAPLYMIVCVKLVHNNATYSKVTSSTILKYFLHFLNIFVNINVIHNHV